MKRSGEEKLLKVFRRLEYEKPRRKLFGLMEELDQVADFVYVMHPRFVHRDEYSHRGEEPKYFRLSKN